MTTDKQKRAVRYCEKWMHVTFVGDIDNYRDVSSFLSEYLQSANEREEEASYHLDDW